MSKKKLQWKNLTNSEVLDCGDFYISYNPNTNKEGLGKLLNELGGLVGGLAGLEVETDGRPETAVVKGKVFLILNGDFRKDYEKIAPKGFTACREFFMKNKEHRSNWTTPGY